MRPSNSYRFDPCGDNGGVIHVDQVMCSPCTAQGFCRLGLKNARFDAETVSMEMEASCAAVNSGADGIAHGGWTASILDDACGFLMIYAGRWNVTKSLDVRFVRPSPTDRPLIVRSRLVDHMGDRWRIAGEIVLADTGVKLASATGIFVEPAEGHFERAAEL